MLAVAVVVAMVLVAATAGQAQEDRSARMKDLFLRGVKAFNAGRYADASDLFQQVLKLNPTSHDALDMRQMADAHFFVTVMTRDPGEANEKTRSAMFQILELASEAEKTRLTDEGRIKQLIEQLAGTREEQARAYLGLVSAGRYAVPHLVARLYDTEAADYKDYLVWSTVALIRIGEEAVLPLAATLRADKYEVRQQVCFILGRIADPRAVPYLLWAAQSDPEPSVRHVAELALDRLRGTIDVVMKRPEVALFELARLYYFEHPSVTAVSPFGGPEERAMWNWSTEKKRLVMQGVPDFLYNVEMARQVATDAMHAAPGYEPTLPLLISAYHKEVVLLLRRLEAARTNPRRELTEAQERLARMRLAKSREVLVTLRSAGERHFYRALLLQLRALKTSQLRTLPEVAVRIIDDLAEVASRDLKVYPALPALSAPLEPAVIRARRPSVAAQPKPAPVPAKTAAVKREVAVTTDPMRLFGIAEEQAGAEPTAAVAEPQAAPAAGDKATTEPLSLARVIVEARQQRTTAKEAEKADKEGEAVAATGGNPLVRALANRDKGISYAAAAALVRIGPRIEFQGSRVVVDRLAEALNEPGTSTVLVVAADDELANRVRDWLRQGEYVESHARTAAKARQLAHTPARKDLILLSADMERAFEELKKDITLAGIPIIVFAAGEAAAAERTYGDRAAAVVSLAAGREKVLAAVSQTIFQNRTAAEGRRLARQYAHTAAVALRSIPATGSPFSDQLSRIKDDLKGVLRHKDVVVRMAAISTLGKAGASALVPHFIEIVKDGDRSLDERRTALRAIGHTLGAGQTAPPEVVDLVTWLHRSGEAELRQTVADVFPGVSMPPAALEKLINEQEAGSVEPAPAPSSPATPTPAPAPPAAPAAPPADKSDDAGDGVGAF
jgi:HEAT repeat protein